MSKYYKSNGHYVDEDVVEEIRSDAINECIKIIEECVWKDSDMLVDLIKEQIK